MTSTTSASTTSPAPPAPAGPAMPAARQRTGAGPVGLAGPAMAVLLAALGVVLLHDAIAETDTRPGRTWTVATLDGLNGRTAEWWMIPLGVAVALIGVWLIAAALRPRSRKTLAVSSATGIFLRTGDIARLASAAADDVDGVLSARTVAGRRKITTTVVSDRDDVADLVRDAVTARLSPLHQPPPVKVRVRAHYAYREGN